GRPMLVMPRAWDQPDNAARVARLGIARVVRPQHYMASHVATELQNLLNDTFRERAQAVANQMSSEDGVATACEAISKRSSTDLTHHQARPQLSNGSQSR